MRHVQNDVYIPLSSTVDFLELLRLRDFFVRNNFLNIFSDFKKFYMTQNNIFPSELYHSANVTLSMVNL